MGDLVRKLGERVLPEIIPILEKGLDSKRSDERQGVCIGLSEIMASTSRDHVSSLFNFTAQMNKLCVCVRVMYQEHIQLFRELITCHNYIVANQKKPNCTCMNLTLSQMVTQSSVRWN